MYWKLVVLFQWKLMNTKKECSSALYMARLAVAGMKYCLECPYIRNRLNVLI